jgi:peptidoglycan-N-acetylglucosamine deacetylase
MNNLIWPFLCLACVIPVNRRPSSRPELWAFTGPWDPRSDSSLRANAARLDAAVTGWIGLDSVSAQPIIPTLYPDTMHLAGAPKRMAIVTSWHGDRFHPSTVRALARDDARLGRAAGAIARHAAAMRYVGLVLDLEALERSDLPALLRVVKAIADSAHARHISPIVVAIPAADSAYPGRAIAGVADLIMPMLYDQHWSTSKPGPISEPDWVRTTLAARIAEVGAARIVAALPTYGYRWQAKPGTAAEDVSFADAKRIAAQSGVALTRDARTGTLRGVKPGAWEIWVTDADLLGTLARQAGEAGVTRVALWRIGQEDPGVWHALAR